MLQHTQPPKVSAYVVTKTKRGAKTEQARHTNTGKRRPKAVVVQFEERGVRHLDKLPEDTKVLANNVYELPSLKVGIQFVQISASKTQSNTEN